MKLINRIDALKLLNDSELDLIIEIAFKILESTGFIIEHNKILMEVIGQAKQDLWKIRLKFITSKF